MTEFPRRDRDRAYAEVLGDADLEKCWQRMTYSGHYRFYREIGYQRVMMQL